jgi:hypothetical protein
MEIMRVLYFHTRRAVPVHPPEDLAEFELLYKILLSPDVTHRDYCHADYTLFYDDSSDGSIVGGVWEEIIDRA